MRSSAHLSTIPGAGTAMTAGPPVPSSGYDASQGAAVTDQRQDVEVAGAARWYLLTTQGPGAPALRSAGRAGAASPQTPSGPVPWSRLPRPGRGGCHPPATSMFVALGQKAGTRHRDDDHATG